MPLNRKTPEQVRKLFEKVQEKVNRGATIAEACAEVGANKSRFYTWRKVQRLRAKTSYKEEAPPMKVTSFPIESKGDGKFTFSGDPRQVAEFLHEMAKQFGGGRHG